MVEQEWKVGDLARATGLTVRTLHHYDAIGLLSPSRRTSAGHRIYDDTDVQRLYRIGLLRRLGLQLDEIAHVLDDPAWGLGSAMTRHLAEVDRRLDANRALRERLARMVARLADDDPPATEDLLDTLEEMTMLETTVQRRISLLVCEDIAAMHDYLVRVYGLGAGTVERDEDGRAIHGEVRAGDGVIWLHRVSPDFKLASPRMLGAATACTAVVVDDVDAHHAHAVAEGASIAYPPTDQPYGMREYGTHDPEGHLWSFMTPLD